MRRRACIHESGHAVLACVHGLPLSHIMILAEGSDTAVTGFVGETGLEFGKLVSYIEPNGVQDPDHIRRVVAFNLGGEIAETGRWSGTAGKDAPLAMKYAKMITVDPASLIADEVQRVQQLLRDHEARRIRLADALTALRPPSDWSPVPSSTMPLAQILAVLEL